MTLDTKKPVSAEAGTGFERGADYLAGLLGTSVDSYKPFAMRPFGDRQVWIGYDPAETGDCSGMVVVAPP